MISFKMNKNNFRFYQFFEILTHFCIRIQKKIENSMIYFFLLAQNDYFYQFNFDIETYTLAFLIYLSYQYFIE